jgi:hypothetical protein
MDPVIKLHTLQQLAIFGIDNIIDFDLYCFQTIPVPINFQYLSSACQRKESMD